MNCRPTDFPVSEAVLKAFRDFVAGDPVFKDWRRWLITTAHLSKFNCASTSVTAAYGGVMAGGVLITTDDQQVARAVDVLPRARDLGDVCTKRQITTVNFWQ